MEQLTIKRPVFNRQRSLVLRGLQGTKIRLSAHSGTGSTVPAWNDAGWSVITLGSNGIADVGAGVRETNNNVTSPIVLSLGARSSRYIKVEAYNNGSHDDGSYIELRALKLF
jgi:hypothetical protein